MPGRRSGLDRASLVHASNSHTHFRQVFAASWRVTPELCWNSSPLKRRARGDPKKGAGDPEKGAGNAGRPVRPQPRVRKVLAEMHTSIHSEFTGITRHSRTQWFYGLLRALPGDRAFLPPSSVRSDITCVMRRYHLTPASRRQDHTTWPSARRALVRSAARVHRIPPRVRDDRDTPLLWDETAADMPVIWGNTKRKYFSLWDSTAATTPNLARRARFFISEHDLLQMSASVRTPD